MFLKTYFMFYTFFIHSVKGLIRNIRFDVNFTAKVISSISIMYLYFAIVYLGYNFETLFHFYKPNLNPIESCNSILIYLFLIGVLLLYYFQKKYSIDIVPYLHLPVHRGKIIAYVLVLTVINFFSIGFTLFIIPFSIKYLIPIYGIENSILYLIGILLIITFVSYLALFLKIITGFSSIFGLLPLLLLFIVILLKGLFHLSIETISNEIFLSLLKGNYLIVLIISLLMAGLLYTNYKLMRKMVFSLHSVEIHSIKVSDRSKIDFFNKNLFWYGLMEIFLILRNKRLIVFFISSVGFLLLFYNILRNNYNNIYFSFIIFILLSGIFGYIFSQYLFSWESSYFDFIFSTKFDVIKYLRAKHIIYVSLGFLVFFIFLPIIANMEYGIHLFLTALLFNSCIGYFILFFMATFNNSRIDLNSKVFLNHQGYNGTQFIAILIILIIPYIILLLFNTIMSVSLSLLFINLLSIFSLLYQKRWFGIILRQLKNRKYINMEGYRK
jgi:hypothetical protein